MEDLRVPPQELGECGLADAQLAEVVEHGHDVLFDAAAEDERVAVDVVNGEAEGVEEFDALVHDVDGDGELEAVELVGDDAEGAQELVDAGAVGGTLGLHLLEAGPRVEGGGGGPAGGVGGAARRGSGSSQRGGGGGGVRPSPVGFLGVKDGVFRKGVLVGEADDG